MGCKLYLMDLTSAFCAPFPGEKGDTHTKQSSMETLEGAHIHLTYPPQYPRLATYTPDAHVCVQNSITHLLILHRDI